MKFLVLGCNGMAGHMISLYLKERGHDVLGFARKKSALVNSVIGDATDSALIKEIIGINRFDSVINCIGILNQFAEDNKADAIYLNSYLPHLLAQITEGTNTQVIHMSTDCVFSGKRGQYTESDFKDGESFYDRSKALGELFEDKNITLRTSIVGPDMSINGIGLMNWFFKQEGEINGYVNAIWTGQTTLQLAKTMEEAAKERAHGLFNVVPDSSISKFELLGLFNTILRKNKITIVPVENSLVDKSLKRTCWEFNYHIPDYEYMVRELADWMVRHKNLYPHYDI